MIPSLRLSHLYCILWKLSFTTRLPGVPTRSLVKFSWKLGAFIWSKMLWLWISYLSTNSKDLENDLHVTFIKYIKFCNVFYDMILFLKLNCYSRLSWELRELLIKCISNIHLFKILKSLSNIQTKTKLLF